MEKCSIGLMFSGRQFYRSTIRLKKENLKTSVLKRPYPSVASLFLMLYLGVLNEKPGDMEKIFASKSACMG